MTNYSWSVGKLSIRNDSEHVWVAKLDRQADTKLAKEIAKLTIKGYEALADHAVPGSGKVVGPTLTWAFKKMQNFTPQVVMLQPGGFCVLVQVDVL